MKWFFAALALASLTSCNTTIGVGRDIKAGYYWTKEKIQDGGSSGGSAEETITYDQGAPVY